METHTITYCSPDKCQAFMDPLDLSFNPKTSKSKRQPLLKTPLTEDISTSPYYVSPKTSPTSSFKPSSIVPSFSPPSSLSPSSSFSSSSSSSYLAQSPPQNPPSYMEDLSTHNSTYVNLVPEVSNFNLPYEDDGEFPAPSAGNSKEPKSPISSPSYSDASPSSKVCFLANSITALIQTIFALVNSNDSHFSLNKEDRSRIQFLKDTVDLISDYVSNQCEIVRKISPYNELLGFLIRRMTEIWEILKQIQDRHSTITENFDIFELKLRSHLDELTSMFPNGNSRFIVYPSEIISDSDAKSTWDFHFGTDVFLVSFHQFLEMLQNSNIFSPENRRFRLFLEYFVNFPCDDYVSTYKWDSLVRLFGPFRSFSTNFSDIVTRRGFLGLVNRIKAYEILSLVREPKCLLIRLSRTEPQYLAFSYKDADGNIAHQVNKDRKTRLPIPVSKFIKTKFPGYTLINMSVDIEQILGKSEYLSLSQYASAQSEYILSCSEN
jgi:hypothetical protein